MSKSVVVIGGGFAGLSAATALAEQGCRVTLLEGRQILGGRAYSFADPKTGNHVDNGQHLFMGCYHETIAFLARIGTLNRLTFQSTLSVGFLGSGNRRAILDCLHLPPPWHLYSGLLRLKTLSWGDRWRLRHVQAALEKKTPVEELDQLTVEEWLTRCHQSERAKRHLWDLITIACLNEDAHTASAATFVAVLRQAFFENLQASSLAFANVGLSDLYVTESLAYLRNKNAEVRLKCPVQRLEIREGGRVTGVILRDGGRLEADAVVSAVPPWAMLKLLPELLVERETYFRKIAALTYSPIISIHLWFDRAITSELFVGLLDTHIQWLFNRSKMLKTPHPSPLPGERVQGEGGYVSLVISAAHDFVDWTDTKILSMAMEELRRLFPKVQEASLVRSLVIKETHATLSPKVGSESLRPSFQSPIEGLYLAGDWTRTGLPGTIESACVSGHQCAELILRSSSSQVVSGDPVSLKPLDPGLRHAGVTPSGISHA